MAQIKVYVPDELERKIKQEALNAQTSVSGFIVDALREKLEPRSWSPAFLALLKSDPLEIAEVTDLPLQRRSALEDL